MANKQFTDMTVWQDSHKLALNIYKATRQFPRDELFGLTSQVRRAAVSVPSNLAEGFNRLSLKEKVQFYSISMGSVSEVQSQLMLAKDLGYLSPDELTNLLILSESVHKQLVGLIKSLRSPKA